MKQRVPLFPKATEREYLSDGEGSKKSNAKIQDAHEAIRPTDINRIPSEIKESLSRDQFRLYQLIWETLCRKPYGKRKV